MEWGRPFGDADIGSIASALSTKSEALHLKSDITAAEITTFVPN
jgi:hypothetical protein